MPDQTTIPTKSKQEKPQFVILFGQINPPFKINKVQGLVGVGAEEEEFSEEDDLPLEASSQQLLNLGVHHLYLPEFDTLVQLNRDGVNLGIEERLVTSIMKALKKEGIALPEVLLPKAGMSGSSYQHFSLTDRRRINKYIGSQPSLALKYASKVGA